MKQLLYLLTALLSFQLSVAQKPTTKIEMNASNWDLPQEATFERFDNRETLLLNGKSIVKNQKFTSGTIEVDVYVNSARSFAGIIFRKQKHTMEEVYMRLHKSNQVDAIQYSPTFNDELTWQLYKEYQAKVFFKKTGWNTLRIEVNNRNADIFVNDEKVLSVDNLRTAHNTGEIGLFALFTNRFSNFRYTIKDTVDNSETDNNNFIDSNIISEWQIIQAMTYKEKEFRLDNFSKEKYMTVMTEKSGLLPISKYIEKPSSGSFEQNNEAFTIASTIVYSNSSQIKLFSFDYSDKIIVYLNGKAIFKGNNAFRSKGVQHTGHIDINANKLYLQLKKGVNKLHCVVIDKANGWGLIAKLE